ncbi:MAG: hypothetical protein ABFS46_16125 [Myxococcota bacterium]
MKRRHLFEFNDQPWVPAWFREYETDYLHTVLERMRLFDPVVPLLADLLAHSESQRIVDLCSGSGGPIPSLRARLRSDHGLDCPALLTDRFPSASARERLPLEEDGLRYLGEPVDALGVPRHLDGVRTLFDALHHFRPDQAQRILADARDAEVPVGVFEISRRSLATVVTSPLIILLVLLLTPAIRPFSWRRLLFTYLLPALPLAIWWDGLVSNLRAYTPHELEAMTRPLNDARYRFEAKALGSGAVRITCVLGRPGR